MSVIPRAESAAPRGSDGAAPSATISSLLLIEDNPGDARLLREMLNVEGARHTRLTHVSRMSEAEKHLAEHAVDIILLDPGLPDAQGMGAVRRAHAAAPRVPLVVLTGLDDESLAAEALHEGAQDYLIKGQIEARGLLRALRYAVERAERERGQEALGRSEARMKSVLDATLDAVIMMDDQGCVISWNGRAETLFGWTPEEAMGREVAGLIIPLRNRESHTRALAQYRATRDATVVGRRIEATGLRRDSSEFPIELTLSALQEGETLFFTAFVADITERKSAQADLEAVQRRLDHVVSSSPVVLFLLKLEAGAFSVDWVSKNIERQLGYSPDEIQPGWWEAQLHPDDLLRAKAEMARLLTEPHLQLEYRLRTKPGAFQWLRAELRVLRDAAGQPVEAVGSWADVTARKEAELRLQQREEQYRVLFESNPHPMYVFDAETLAFLAVNEAAVHHYGYSSEEMLAMKLADLSPPDDVQTATPTGLVQHRRKDGTLVQMDVMRNRIRLRGRQAWLALATDVTEKHSLEAQLLQSQKMESVGRLAGGVAHDFNNILGVITGYGELLVRHASGDAKLKRYADDIVKAAARGAGLTRQLLAFSRKQVLQPRILDLNIVIGDMEAMLRRLIGEDIQLLTTFAEGLGLVTADPGQLEQILMNLSVNARDAMPRGGSLIIETANTVVDDNHARGHAGLPSGAYVMLAVRDTGHGMTPEVQARVFEPFFTTKDAARGTGLGLATVHGIVQQSGGYLWVESEPGHGTTFKILFPSVDGDQPADPLPSIDTDLPRGTETVLVVEDEASLREIIRDCLEDAGYTVLSAAHGKEALALCAGTCDIRLLVTDVVMPGMGGRELAERIQTECPDMRVLYMSGYTDDAVVLHGVMSEEMAFLQKPFSCEALAQKVRQVLDAPP